MSYSVESEKLFDLYRDLDVVLQKERYAEVESGIDASVEQEDEGRYSLSQWQLMWRKFIRNRAALAGGVIILMLYVTALFANFIAPYTLTTRFRDRIYLAPQRVDFFDEGRFAPFVYGASTALDLETP